MAYFVTGATGFIGRHLVEQLLDAPGQDLRARARGLARAPGRPDRALGRRRATRVKPVDRRSARSRCSASTRTRSPSCAASVDHFFHLAAIYDMTADDERNAALNVGGTQHAVELANALERRAPAPRLLDRGRRRATRASSREDMFDEGQKLPSPYHRTKFESEQIVREQSRCRGASTAPAIVVGDSQTGEMDKIDGPYYFFKAIQRLAPAAARVGRRWSALELGYTNVVPVDYVAARDGPHRPRADGLDGQAFHLTDPQAASASGERDQRVRRGRARAAAGDAHRQDA